MMELTLPPSLEYIGFGPSGWGKPLLVASGMTIAVSCIGFTLGLFLGAGIACAKLSNVTTLKRTAGFYTKIVRGVPELLVLYFLFFGGSAILTEVSAIFKGSGFLGAPAFLTGLLALALISAAYIAEVFRGAWQAIDTGQMDAAKALGMNRIICIWKIMLPQVMRLSLPGLGNIWQLTLKESALISLTGLTELMRQAVIASNATSKPFYFYSTAAVIYLAITTVSSVVFLKAEQASRRGYSGS